MKTTTTPKVKIYRDIVHYLPCSTSNVRTKGWEQVKVYDDFKVVTRAWETITVTDIFILISAVKYFEDNKTDIIEGQIIEERKTVAIKIKLSVFLYSYLHNHDVEHLKKALRRLTSMQVFFMQKDGSEDLQRYLMDYKISASGDGQELLLVLNKSFYDYCLSHGLTLNFHQLQTTKSPTAKALFIYISGQKNRRFHQETLERVLNLKDEAFKNRWKIKKAFAELEQHNIIINPELEKTPKGWIFSYS